MLRRHSKLVLKPKKKQKIKIIIWMKKKMAAMKKFQIDERKKTKNIFFKMFR